MKKVTSKAKVAADVFEEDTGVAVTDKQLSVISTLAFRQRGLEEAIEKQNDVLAQLVADLRQVQEFDLPDAMKEVQLSEFKLLDGTRITVKEEIYPNIPQDRKAEAYAWLDKNGHGDLIKKELVTKLARGKEGVAAAKQIKALVDKLGLDIAIKEGVHANTLKAFVKEQLEEGTVLPECIGVHKVNKSIVKMA